MPFSILRNRPKLQRQVEFSIKLVILLLLFASLYWQLVEKENISKIFLDFKGALSLNGNLILLVFLLMFVNWGLEAAKWWLLINKLQRLSFVKAVLAIFSGATLTLFTPNRIGEYGGRFIFLDNPLRLDALQATLLGSVAQIWVTILAGLGGFVWWLSQSHHFGKGIALGFNLTIAVCVLLLSWLYFRLGFLANLLGRIKFLAKYQHKWQQVAHYSHTDLLFVLLLAGLRYAVYTGQYVLLLHAFGVAMPLGNSVALIATMFLLQSIVPSIAIIDLGIRGNLALFVFTGFTLALNQVVAAAFCLWFINLVLPALLGYLAIVATRMFNG